MDVAHVGLAHCDPCRCKVKSFRAISSIERNVSKEALRRDAIAASKENTTPFLKMSLNLLTSDFPNLCGLRLVLGFSWSCLMLMNLGFGYAPTKSTCAFFKASTCKALLHFFCPRLIFNKLGRCLELFRSENLFGTSPQMIHHLVCNIRILGQNPPRCRYNVSDFLR